jgi:hypothetical protein
LSATPSLTAGVPLVAGDGVRDGVRDDAVPRAVDAELVAVESVVDESAARADVDVLVVDLRVVLVD